MKNAQCRKCMHSIEIPCIFCGEHQLFCDETNTTHSYFIIINECIFFEPKET